MFPLQLQMGAAILGLSEEKAESTNHVNRVQELERAECRLAMEKVARDEVEVEVS